MLRTRLWMGAVLIVLVIGVLLFDQRFEPWFPFLFMFMGVLAVVGTVELVRLIESQRRPRLWLCLVGALGMLLANWNVAKGWQPWPLVAGVLAAVTLAAFLCEMATFREPGQALPRLGMTCFALVYLGLLPCFLAQVRWLPGSRGVDAIALAIFVPKVCDIGAYFSGRLFGRHRMSPVLSPKKTWEGFAGGMVIAMLFAILLNRLVPALRDDWLALGFGATVGLFGVLGDLAESLIKRDCQYKDASQVVPGFGGVLDVVDSVIFAAPVAYLWFCI